MCNTKIRYIHWVCHSEQDLVRKLFGTAAVPASEIGNIDLSDRQYHHDDTISDDFVGSGDHFAPDAQPPIPEDDYDVPLVPPSFPVPSPPDSLEPLLLTIDDAPHFPQNEVLDEEHARSVHEYEQRRAAAASSSSSSFSLEPMHNTQGSRKMRVKSLEPPAEVKLPSVLVGPDEAVYHLNLVGDYAYDPMIHEDDTKGTVTYRLDGFSDDSVMIGVGCVCCHWMNNQMDRILNDPIVRAKVVNAASLEIIDLKGKAREDYERASPEMQRRIRTRCRIHQLIKEAGDSCVCNRVRLFNRDLRKQKANEAKKVQRSDPNYVPEKKTKREEEEDKDDESLEVDVVDEDREAEEAEEEVKAREEDNVNKSSDIRIKRKKKKHRHRHQESQPKLSASGRPQRSKSATTRNSLDKEFVPKSNEEDDDGSESV